MNNTLAQYVRQAQRSAENVSGWSGYEPLELVRRLTKARADFEAAQSLAVMHALETGATWQHVGSELGVTKQAAQQKYGKLWSSYRRDVLLQKD